MSTPFALTKVHDAADASFFLKHPDRKTHIRKPWALGGMTECEAEFQLLGPHDRTRRRLVLWKIPKNNPFYGRFKDGVLKIPFLAFADETIEDRDDILEPVVHEIMMNQRAS